MDFDLEMGNCFLMERNDKTLLVIDKNCINNISKVKVGLMIDIVQYFRHFIVTSVYYNSTYGIYILGLETKPL